VKDGPSELLAQEAKEMLREKLAIALHVVRLIARDDGGDVGACGDQGTDHHCTGQPALASVLVGHQSQRLGQASSPMGLGDRSIAVGVLHVISLSTPTPGYQER
jgi:hypothetical protein